MPHLETNIRLHSFFSGIGVCEGDSGGGLVFRKTDLHRNRYYLRGIVSTAPQVNGSCNEYKYAFYTKVSTYLNYIKPKVDQYKDRN